MRKKKLRKKVYKEGDSMRIPGVLDYTEAKYPFKKVLKGLDGLKWISVKSNSGKTLYVPTRKNEAGEDVAIEYDALGRFNGYELLNYSSPKHIISHNFTNEDKRNNFYKTNMYVANLDLPELEVVGNKNNIGKIKNLFIDTFGEDVGNDLYKFITDMSKSNNLNLRQTADKYFELYNLSGRPKLGKAATAFQLIPAISSFIKTGNFKEGWNRAMINPLTNYIHYDTPNEAITEFGHGFNQSSNLFILSNPNFLEDLSLYLTYPSDTSRTVDGKYYKKGYDNPGHNEYKAHKVIEPLMWAYFMLPKENNFVDFLNKYTKGLDVKAARYVLLVSGPRYIKDMTVPRIKTGIKIKKENRGKFTEYCGGKVTLECINRAKRSGNKTLVKRATFAANVRKWKH